MTKMNFEFVSSGINFKNILNHKAWLKRMNVCMHYLSGYLKAF